jgi:hypothetical protein
MFIDEQTPEILDVSLRVNVTISKFKLEYIDGSPLKQILGTLQCFQLMFF